MSDAPPLLEFVGVTKRFGAITALDGVAFELREGEIHALLGENGAGKSTLIKILAGVHAPDSGSVRVSGRPVPIRNVADADRLGVRVIHQELSLAANLSIAENIYLGREPHSYGWLRRGRMIADAEALVASLGLTEIRSVRTPVGQLSVAHQQLVEIARALSAEAKILVLDEPTSALSEAETTALFSTLRRLKTQGVGIIYISHRLDEIMQLADRVTVLRDGRVIGTQRVAELNQRELVRWMVGREIANYFHRPAQRPGGPALEVRDLTNEHVQGVSFPLHHGEILGIAGLVGSGRSELVRAIFGIDPIAKGQVLVEGRSLSISNPRDAIEAGIVLVPEDRKRDGLMLIQSVAFNLSLPWVDEWMRGCWPNWRRQNAIVSKAMQGFGIRAADPDVATGTLSGGNQQKVLVGRWMERRPKVLILDEPTRGVDVGAREEMCSIIRRLVEEGMAVLLISSDLTEVLEMSHRVALYRDGRLLKIVPANEVTAESVMHELAAGSEWVPARGNDEND